MKHIYYIVSIFLLIAGKTNAQKVKLFGYEQAVSKGIVAARDLDENGKEIKKKIEGQNLNYYIYLTCPSRSSVEADEIWIYGKGFTVNNRKIDNTPVTIVNYNIPSNPKSTVVVPATKDNVYQLIPDKYIRSSSFAEVTRYTNTNDLVVLYKIGKTWKVIRLKKLGKLELTVTQ
ncbi:MAG: hypothetical protein ACJ748_17035 [Flavisolibacter sp.]